MAASSRRKAAFVDSGTWSDSKASDESQSRASSPKSPFSTPGQGGAHDHNVDFYQYGYFELEHNSSDQIKDTFDSSIFTENFIRDTIQDSATPFAHQPRHGDALPATSRDFAELFPSSRKLDITHDDTTSDGNMNLLINTSVKLPRGEQRRITLFHLRMQNLKHREFSLRRYCRDSGREVCHTYRKPRTVPQKEARPSPRKDTAVTSASSDSSTSASLGTKLKRQDSGYDSSDDDEVDGNGIEQRGLGLRLGGLKEKLTPKSSDLIAMDFSNYAHLEIQRKGSKAGKHYNFDYWGARYSWRKETTSSFGITRVSFHLLRRNDNQVVAHIVPEQLTEDLQNDELAAGGWVPPCSMWISDRQTIAGPADISDVVVATGLMALVDSSIHQHFKEKEVQQVTIPLPLMQPLQVSLDNLGPKNLIEKLRPTSRDG